MNDLRMCINCKHDIDIYPPNRCEYGEHVWHEPHLDTPDMCCECGVDVDYLDK